MASRNLALVALVALFLTASPDRVLADGLAELAKLEASDAAEFDHFGNAVAVEGDVAFVGAYLDDDDGVASGSVYVYRFDGTAWVEEQKLTASDAGDRDNFGFSIALDGDTALIGSDPELGTAGAAYVFRFDGSMWVEEQRLSASDGGLRDRFARSVSLAGDLAVIGAPDHGEDVRESGAAYVFRFDGSSWVEEQKLTASDPGEFALFGFSVSTDGERMLVGAIGDATSGRSSGASYVFRFDGSSWIEEQKLAASDAAELDYFGWSVSLDGDLALVGAQGDDDDARDSGSSYVFRREGSSWGEEAKLTAGAASIGARFGWAVALEGDAALIGATGAGASFEGAAYLYRFDGSTWVEAQILTAADARENGALGTSVSLDGSVALIGASDQEDDDGTSRVDAAYVFAADCTTGSVNVAAGGDRLNVLFVAGSSGGQDRSVELAEGDLLEVTVVNPGVGGSGKFILHANEGAPAWDTPSVLPFAIGTSCFPFPINRGATPVVVANNLGRTNVAGKNSFFGTPWAAPDLATTILRYPDLPLGTVLTLQAVLDDPGARSARGFSTTNAVIVRVVP